MYRQLSSHIETIASYPNWTRMLHPSEKPVALEPLLYNQGYADTIVNISWITLDRSDWA